MARTYSTIMRPCNGTTENPLSEIGPFAWDNSMSVSDGYGTLTKTFYFTYDDTSIQPYEICPAEVFRSSGFPRKYDRLPEDTKFHYTGNGTIEHVSDGSRIWKFSAEYTNKNDATNDDGDAMDADTKPWKRKPENISLSFVEEVTAFRAAYTSDNKRYGTKQSPGRPVCSKRTVLAPVVNTAGDPLNAQTANYKLQLQFTYNLSPSAFDMDDMLDCFNSTNKNKIKVLGITIPEGMGKIIDLAPSYVKDEETEDEEYWQISATILFDTDGSGFNQKLLNIGNRARFPKNASMSSNGVVSYSGSSLTAPQQVYYWWSWDTSSGQMSNNGSLQFGPKNLVARAAGLFNKLAIEHTSMGSFGYEAGENIPLNNNGTVDTAAFDINDSSFGDYKVLEYKEFKSKSWSCLNFPTKGVDW